LLKPEYNICKTAGSTLGKLHSANTKEKISNSMKGKVNPFLGKHHTLETRKNISKNFLSRVHIIPNVHIETKLKLSLRSIGIKIKVYDSSNTFIIEFPTINSTAKYFNIDSTIIKRVIKSGTSYKNHYFKSEIIDNRI
jgi:group I intron endonuclease